MTGSCEAKSSPPKGSWLGADAPSERGEAPPWRAYAWAVGSVVACTLIAQALFGRISESNVILVYLLGILPVALRGDRGAAIMAAVLSVAAFDFFFVHPYLTFAVSDAQYLLTFVVMGLVGIVISTLTSRLVDQLSVARKIALDEAIAREEADRALRRAEEEGMRSALLSSVSHDLRTPLTGIVGAASSLVDGADKLSLDVRRELAQGIVEEANRMGRLVTNLLNATRLESGSVQLACSWFPLEEAIGPALTRLLPELAHHPVSIELPPDLPLAHADPILVEQVFANLFENAAKYSPANTPVLVRAWPEAGRLWVEVSDRGPGLPPGEEERVFEKFRRYPARSGSAGAGLGLAIARGVVQAHGGAMSAYNLPEGGAAFRFSLPLAPGDCAPR